MSQLTHLVIRIGQHEDKWHEKKLIGDTISEHNKICSEHKRVFMGKLGKSLPSYRVDQLRQCIEEQSKTQLIIARKKGKDYEGFCAPLKGVNSEGFSPPEFLVPAYYRHLIPDISNWFEIGALDPLSLASLKKFKLLSNGRPVIDVFKACRTSLMFVS